MVYQKYHSISILLNQWYCFYDNKYKADLRVQKNFSIRFFAHNDIRYIRLWQSWQYIA